MTEKLFLVVCKQIYHKFLTFEYLSYRDHGALFGLRFLIIFKISYVENSTVESDWHVFLVRTEGSLLLSLTREHCLVKKSLKSSAFSLKSMINLPLCNSGGIQGIFLLFRKVFNIGQYNFGFILLSNSLLDRRE